MTGPRRHVWLLLVAVVAVGGCLLYGAAPVPRFLLAASSTTFAIMVIVHLAVLAAALAALRIRRRRVRGRESPPASRVP